ncbi:putative bifunctional diguanylate cyclase/phosphodiesterase [Xanthomonas phaseoli]|uniref:cyclic-guanylate-specific phosphodiesterase n=2 Tax=Xanthomonas TaxID=338 RepID=A0A1V9HAQ4_9XANT|nr:EAL domain-containing protein [Xanthomonas phaseoli]MBO9790112.1 bifunctional diguanylate cyclase/phosphodiesterase [Xanthomonas phaseoli pv. dieffenbachiae]MBO9884300.1 bifunctional diguanylate cyclase/phosphodiesterase [Xanthomonas phaseoli pv. dieffenbachiae]MBO9914114.1 bifunctional diguanylate cyclase/phosphodiesterase [Xanthomonas phaseoli pv. dieffenbachiae]MBO9940441.1 bifunctional diguanylate cyclase/phosphodiesterase [Xanthomonas phaseoli pv. dieffenbachiae]MBO9996327.1 bifunction
MVGTYNPGMVMLSLVVAVLASYTALYLAARTTASRGGIAAAWLVGGAIAMGIGIWSMHFVGMLAFRLPIPVGYDLALTCYSMLAAILTSALALWLTSRADLPLLRLGLGALLMGLGIALMHYMGMDALRMVPAIRYDPLLFGLSIAIAVGASAAALWIAFRLRHDGQRSSLRLNAASIMGVAIVGVHYTGMAAAQFAPGSVCGAVAEMHLPLSWLTAVVVLVTLVLLMLALVISLLSRRFQQRTDVLAQSLAKANAELALATLHDPLTRLPNRILLHEHLVQNIERAQRQGQRFAVLLINLDGFKVINDGYGHVLGDRLLVVVAERLNAHQRAHGSLARLGADEFVLVADIADPEDAGSEHQLLTHADAAMTHAKHAGRNRYSFFERSMTATTRDRLQLLQELPRALELGQFVLHYQPKYCAEDGRPIGAEALIRWQHPERGLVPPDSFIPLAERSGMIGLLGSWVLRQACRQMRDWRQAGHGDWRVAVNLSALQLASPSLLDEVATTLSEYALAPGQLTLEITETMAMRDAEAYLRTLGQLNALGVRIAIDDFGTGYSNLLYLRKLPAHELKIDRSFVQAMDGSAEDIAIVAAVVALAHTMRLQVVAEGVETLAQRNTLERLGCDQLQGYLLGRPMDAERFIATVVAERDGPRRLAS